MLPFREKRGRFRARKKWFPPWEVRFLIGRRKPGVSYRKLYHLSEETFAPW
ncbi:hypothetical protein EVA_17930 [gut metagenome]|uniref:Uncharacterized protein n=1 Tax=gut metagenome TaxID=749906 RepID=J9FWL7_9ZZZZ